MIVSDSLETAREYLGVSTVELVNRLAQNYIPGDTQLVLQYPLQGVGQGVLVCVGLNSFIVWDAQSTSQTLTVSGAWGNSPDLPASIGDLVRIRPNVATHRIFNEMNNVLNELSSPSLGLYGIDQVEVPWITDQVVYDLSGADGLMDVLRVAIGDPTDTLDRWADLDQNEWQFRVISPTIDFPSGQQLRITADMANPMPGDTLRITYKRSFVSFDTLGSDMSMSYLPESAYDLPALGAAARLAIPMELKRNTITAQPDTRRMTEVPPGALIGSARALDAQYQRRVAQEAARLLRQFPPKRR